MSKRPEWDRLLACAQKNNANEIHRLINEEKIDPSHSNAVGQSALHVACIWGNIEGKEPLLIYICLCV
jgi:ankyrin repeat protein